MIIIKKKERAGFDFLEYMQRGCAEKKSARKTGTKVWQRTTHIIRKKPTVYSSSLLRRWVIKLCLHARTLIYEQVWKNFSFLRQYLASCAANKTRYPSSWVVLFFFFFFNDGRTRVSLVNQELRDDWEVGSGSYQVFQLHMSGGLTDEQRRTELCLVLL